MRTTLAALLLAGAVLAGPGGAPAGAAERTGPLAPAPLPPIPPLEISPEPVAGGEGLSVVQALPTGPAHGNIRPTVTFSRPVVPLGAATATRPEPARIDPPVAGEWRWIGSASVEFVARDPWPLGTHFDVEVAAGLQAVDGSRLAQAYRFAFETQRPGLQEVEPRDGWPWATPDQRFSLTFDQPVADLAGHLDLRVAGEPWPLRILKESAPADDEPEARRLRRFRPNGPAPGSADLRRRYQIGPGRPLPLDREVTLALSGTLRGLQGPLEMGAGKSWRFRTHGPMRVESITACDPEWSRTCSYGPLVVTTSNQPDPATLRARLRVEPPVEIDWERVRVGEGGYGWRRGGAGWRLPTLSIPGKFRPGTRYRVTLAAGLGDVFGQAAAAADAGVQTSDLVPSFDLGPDIALLEASGDGALPVEASNLSGLDVRLWPLTPAEAAPLLARWNDGAWIQPPRAPVPHRLDLSGPRNVKRTRPLQIRRLLGNQRSRLFLVEATSSEVPEEYRGRARVLGQITDLAVHAKLGPASGLVWVTGLADGKPVAGAEVAVHDDKGARRWTGLTDADGLARVPGLAELIPGEPDRWTTPFALVAASKGGDTGVTLSTWSGGFSPWAFGVQGDWEGNTPRSLGLVVPERGIYRPGDTVFLKGLARFRKLGAIRTPAAGTAVEVKVVSSRGKEVLTRGLSTTAFGTFSTSFALAADVPLGTYQVSARAKVDGKEVSYGGSFRVEEYRAPQFRVDVAAPAANLVTGDAVEARVLARYLFGGAMAGAEVRWAAHRSAVAFRPPGNEGFAFGNQAWWWDDREPGPVREVAASGSGVTDALGGFAVQAGQATTPGDRTFEYTLEAEVTDVSRQRLANRAVVTVHPAALYAGVRWRGSGFGEAGKPQTLEVVAVTPDGARQPGEVAVSFKRREWKSIRKKGVGDRWTTVVEPVEEPVGTCQAKAGREPGECTFTPRQPGFHVIEATATDRQGKRQVTRAGSYVVGSGWVSWQRDDSERIDLVPDRESYGVGDTARVLVKSPFPEAEALLTVEREGVLSARRVRLSGAATALEVPVGEEAVPNVFVSVVLVRGRVPAPAGEVSDDPGKPAVRVGYVQLKVEKRNKRLLVEVRPDAAEKRPRDKVRVDLQVRDWKGQGTAAEVAVWAVDEGVLRLTGYQVPDPVEALHPPHGLSVRVGEPMVFLVERRRYGEKGLGEGGSGGADAAGAGFRSAFKTTVLFAPEVRTDESGHARVELKLPDNLTTYRIMALAVTAGDRSGKGESQVVVAKPLLALPALPRLARVGDRFEAGVVVHAPGGKVREALVKAEVSGLVLDGPASRKVALAGGKPAEVRFRFRAEAPGQAVLRFQVSGGGRRDGLEQRIPILLPVEQEAVAIYGDTRDQRREGFAPPSGVRPGVGGLELTLSSTALGGFDETMRQLVEYPYGCLEQLSSRLVPFLALRELQDRFGLPPLPGEPKPAAAWMASWVGEEALRIREAKDADEVVRRTVKAIEGLQGHDGGYRYWPSAGCSAPWASAYAVLALGRAAELGYPVDAAGLRRGQAFLADTVAAGRCTACAWGCATPDLTTRTFALWALARTRAPKASYYGELMARRQGLPLFARAMLVDAMFVGGGDREDARLLLAELMGSARVSPSEVHFEEADPRTWAPLWSSDTRTTAIVLQTLADVSPDHPYVARMAAYLTRARRQDGRFRNTQEAAFTLMALTELTRTKEREVPSFTARVRLGERSVAEVPFQGRSMEVRRVKVPAADLGLGGPQVAFDFRRDGTAGVLYYGALLRYAPAVMPVEPLDRGLFVQRWFEPWEGGGQVRAVRAGDLVRIQVRVGSPTERNYLAVEVPLPAGLEVVDTTLASTARLAGQPLPRRAAPAGEEGDEEGEPEPEPAPSAGGFWSPFNHVERRDDRVVLFADRLPPGVHLATFVARATSPGEFVLKPAHAEEMYAPEVFGRSDGGRFQVLAPEAERR